MKIIKKIIKVVRKDKHVLVSDSIRDLNNGYQILLFVPEDDYVIPDELYPSIGEGISILSDNEVIKISKYLDNSYKLIVVPGWYNDPWNNIECEKFLREFKNKFIPKY